MFSDKYFTEVKPEGHKILSTLISPNYVSFVWVASREKLLIDFLTGQEKHVLISGATDSVIPTYHLPTVEGTPLYLTSINALLLYSGLVHT